MSLRILLLDAYDAASHQYWRAALKQMLPEIEFTELILPPRYFSWRIRGNSLSWGQGDLPQLEPSALKNNYDLVLATSMVDLSALRGFIPLLGLLPTLVYFHENQFEYPLGFTGKQQVEPQIVNLYSALCADAVVFNSEFNRDTFLSGVKKLLKKLPDQIPKGLDQKLSTSSSVLPVPIIELSDTPSLIVKTEALNGINIVWNHRWEYDKGPERLLAFIEQSIEQDLEINYYILGESFRSQPKEFAQIQQLLAANKRQRLVQYGYVDNAVKYHKILQQADYVLSTSLHDFQGLSILQAVAFGVRPLVPNRLAYTQWFGSDACYQSDQNVQQEALSAVGFLKQELRREGELAVIDIDQLSLANMRSDYLQLFEKTITTNAQ